MRTEVFIKLLGPNESIMELLGVTFGLCHEKGTRTLRVPETEKV